MNLNLALETITDPQVRDNFLKIEEAFRDFPLLKGQWEYLTFSCDADGEYTLRHNLPFTPTEAIVARQTNHNYNFVFSDFDEEFIKINVDSSTSGVELRFFIGAYFE